MLQQFGNVFAFENAGDFGYAIRWHRCDGFLGRLSVTELLTLREFIENTFKEYEYLGIDTDEDVKVLNEECLASFNDYQQSIRNTPRAIKEKLKDHLYIIRDLDFSALKIGRSINPESRLRALATSSANRMEIVKVYPEMGCWEEKVHNTLKAAGLHIRSEWFTDDPKVIELVENFLKA